MAIRENDLRLVELRKGGAHIYSISKLNALDGCMREAYYSYRDKAKPKRVPSIYGIMGGQIHEVLEDIYNNRATAEALLPAMLKELEDAEMCGIEFPRDFSGGSLIRDNWVADMTHFCNNFEKLDGDNFSTEELVLYQLGKDRYMMGYIDLISVVDEESKMIDIYDFKTSRKFQKDDLTHHGRQLVFYALAKESEGYQVRNVAWIMLKYAEVTYMSYARVSSKKKTQITKIIQRGKLGKELAGQVESLLREHGYDAIGAEVMATKFRQTNDFAVLPPDIQAEFTVKQYIEYYPYNEETKAETLQYINTRADLFEEYWVKDKAEWPAKEIDRNAAFYCNNLCSHRDICEALKQYNTLLELNNTQDEDLF